MTDEVFDHDKAKPKYELYDVASLYPEKMDDDYVEYLMDWREQRYGIKHPGLDASDEELDAYYDEIDRQDAEADEAWTNRPFIHKFFFALGVPIAILIIIGHLILGAVDFLRDVWDEWKHRREQRKA
jgi:hypothetical protein